MKGQRYHFNHSANFTFFGLFEVHALANQIPQWKVHFNDIDFMYILKTFIVRYVCNKRSMLLSCYKYKMSQFSCIPMYTNCCVAGLFTNK